MVRAAKFMFGLLALGMGAAILIWGAYCFFVPNQYFHWRLIDTPRLGVPLAMVWVGWNWIRGGRTKGQRYSSEITVTLKLSSAGFGTQPERDGILALKHGLEKKLAGECLGRVDGEEFGDGERTLFVQTSSPVDAERVIRSFLTAEAPSLAYSIGTAGL